MSSTMYLVVCFVQEIKKEPHDPLVSYYLQPITTASVSLGNKSLRPTGIGTGRVRTIYSVDDPLRP